MGSKLIDKVWQVISGEKFNLLTKEFNFKFYKLTNKEEIHRSMKYQTGLNIDTERLMDYTNSSGLHFTSEENVDMWEKSLISIGKPVYYKRQVTIPDDAEVYCEYTKFKTNKFILSERQPLKLIYESKLPLFEIITGETFNQLSRDKKFFVVTKCNDTQRDFKSLNVDLSFVEKKFINKQKDLLTYSDNWKCSCQRKIYRRSVTIPSDAKIYCEYEKIKSDKIILGEKEEI